MAIEATASSGLRHREPDRDHHGAADVDGRNAADIIGCSPFHLSLDRDIERGMEHDLTFPQIIDGLAAPIATTSADGLVELANRRLLDYLGVSLEELKDWETTGVVHADDLSGVTTAWRQSLETGEPYELELRVRRAGGVYQWVHIRGVPLRDTQGGIVRWCVLLTDIAERKRTEAFLDGETRLLEMVASGRRLEEILETICGMVDSIVDNGASSVLLIDRNGTFRYGAGPALPAGYEATVDGVSILLEAGPCGTAASLNERVIVPDLVSDPRWIGVGSRTLVLEHGFRSVCSTPITSQGGTVLGTFAIYQRDPGLPSAALTDLMTRFTRVASIAVERAMSERVLQERERESRMVVERIPGLFSTFSPSGEIEILNQRMLEYFGKPLDEMRRWEHNDIIHPEDLPRVRRLFAHAVASQEPLEYEARLRRCDGVYQWFQVRAFPARDREGGVARWYTLVTDIDDRKRAEDALRNSERSLTVTVDTIPALAWSARPDGCAEFFNRHYLEYVGLSAEQASGSGWMAAVHPKDLDELAATWRRILGSEVAGEAEARLRRHDGEYRWFLFRANPLRDQAGVVVKWYGVNTDIEDRKCAEEALRKSERQFRLLVETIPALVWRSTPEGELDYLNRRAIEYLGHTAESLTGGRWLELVHPDHRASTLQRWLHSATTGSSYEDEYRLRRADGKYRWIQSVGQPFHDMEGQLVNWYGLVFDIEDRKQAEVELRRAYDSFADAQRLSHTGSFITDLVGDDHNWSEEAFRIFEFEPGSKVSVQRIRDLIHPDDLPSFESVIARGMAGENVTFAFRLVTVTAGVKHVRGVAHVIERIAGRPLFVGALQDVTESKAAEEALDRARSELAHVARVTAVSAFTASIAHEVNQPLSGIITNAGTCLRMLAADPPDVPGARETARRTLRDGNRASDVITRLRALFSKREFTLESLDLNEVTQEVVALSLSELQRNRIILRSEFAQGLPQVTGDRIQLQQVILNLLRNASDAMANVHDRQRHLMIGTDREADNRVRVTVRDVGVGLDVQSMNKLFDPFYTTKTDGMGIGLSVSRSIIERHHGRLWAQPNDGPGATFAFALPAGSEHLPTARATKV
jgi:PAS domain S-box-containing protein